MSNDDLVLYRSVGRILKLSRFLLISMHVLRSRAASTNEIAQRSRAEASFLLNEKYFLADTEDTQVCHSEGSSVLLRA